MIPLGAYILMGIIILGLLIYFAARQIYLGYKAEISKIKENERRNRALLKQKAKRKKARDIRHSKDKEFWTIEDWNDELKNHDNHNSQKIYWKKQAVLKKDNYRCNFCGTSDKRILEVVYITFWQQFKRIEEYGAKLHPINYETICQNCMIDELSPKEFEHFAGKFFEKKGYTVNVSGKTGDEGIDVVCKSESSDELIVIQCKKYDTKNKVSSSVVRDFYGAMMHLNADKGFIFTTSSFTDPAKEWIKNKPIELWNRRKIIDALNKSQLKIN